MGVEKEWGSEEVTEDFGKDVERYRGNEKRKDLVRIITDPVEYFTHSLDFSPGIINCAKIEKGRCLGCDRGIKRDVKIGCVVVHIQARNADNPNSKWSLVGECKVWLFGKDKWKSLCGIKNDYQKIKDLKKEDLIITCLDEQFQKLEIRPTLEKSRVTKAMVEGYEDAKEKLEWFTQAPDMNRQKEVFGVQGGSGEDLGNTAEQQDTKSKMSQRAEEIASEPAEPASENGSTDSDGDGDVDDILGELNDPNVPF